jgi:hydroxyacylglutathione hydrolase
VRVRGLTLGLLDTNCWLVDDGMGGPIVVIDPAAEPDAISSELEGATVDCVVLTHGHFDHLGAAGAIMELTGAPLLVHVLDSAGITSSEGNGGRLFGFTETAPPADRVLEDGDVIEAGALRLEVIHTPGHTPGGICLFVRDPAGGAPHLISGDTLFASSVGRTDFPGGDVTALRRSIARLAGLPAETIVHPGHGPATTIGREIRVNPFFPRA